MPGPSAGQARGFPQPVGVVGELALATPASLETAYLVGPAGPAAGAGC